MAHDVVKCDTCGDEGSGAQPGEVCRRMEYDEADLTTPITAPCQGHYQLVLSGAELVAEHTGIMDRGEVVLEDVTEDQDTQRRLARLRHPTGNRSFLPRRDKR